ncbi:MAG: DUF6314 family protein [Nocardioides sp.]|nr:DUF6314 family protein [Nocardioides sp.]
MTPLDLLGPWHLAREIDDRHTGQRLRVDGTTRLTVVGEEVGWAESGLLTRPGAAPARVSRRLRVVRREGGWWVLFEDGRDFHPWRPGGWVEHPCGADHYRGRILVDPLPVHPVTWQVTWQVTGPAKDYTAHSVLSRAVD